jgi:ATP-binding cassette subfamily F protein 3
MEYTGTVVFVSHDRYFIDNLATRVFEIGDGKVEIYPGNYEDYLWRKQGGAAAQAQSAATFKKDLAGVTPAKANGNAPSAPAEALPAAKAKRINPIKKKQMEDRSQELETKISDLEDEISRLEAALQNFVSAEESQRQSHELEWNKATHAELIQEWEALAESLQEAE